MSTPTFNFDNLVNGAGGTALSNLTSAAYSQPWTTIGGKIDLGSFRVAGVFTATTPSAGTFTAVGATDIMTKSAHGFITGLVVQVSNSGGALPTNLSASTNYYVIVIDANTFYLATSYANAIAGTRIDLGSNGTGTQTVTPTATAGTIAVQFSNDYIQGATTPAWFTEPNCSQAFTASGSFVFDVDYPRAAAWRVAFLTTAGIFTITSGQVLYAGQE